MIENLSVGFTHKAVIINKTFQEIPEQRISVFVGKIHKIININKQ